MTLPTVWSAIDRTPFIDRLFRQATIMAAKDIASEHNYLIRKQPMNITGRYPSAFCLFIKEVLILVEIFSTKLTTSCLLIICHRASTIILPHFFRSYACLLKVEGILDPKIVGHLNGILIGADVNERPSF